MTVADWALIISILSAAISLAGLAWNIWSTFIYPKPTVRVWFSINRMVPDHAGLGKFLCLSATNHGPNKVILYYAVVTTTPDAKTGSRYGILNPLHNFPHQINHTLGPFSGGLPKTVEIGELFSVYFPFAPKTFLAEDIKKIGFRDTFGKHHWAARRDVKNILAKYRKEHGSLPNQSGDIKRENESAVQPEII